MKIVYDYQIFSSQRFGGISRYFFEIANHLSVIPDESIECRIKSPIYVNEYLKHATSKLKVEGFKLPSIRYTWRIYKTVNLLAAPFVSANWIPDILHETYYTESALKVKQKKIVLTVYDMIHELYSDMFVKRDRTSEIKKAAVNRADHIICISENTRQDLISHLGVSPEKTSVVHLGFSLTQNDVTDDIIQPRPFLLYVGSRWGYKNFERLLAAYGSRKELCEHYDLVAFGGGRFGAYENEIIKRLNLSESKVRHLGGDDGVLASLYKQAAMFVYPSLYEGFGIPPLEAMSFGCPVVCSNTSSIPEVVGDAALQFNPVDIDSISNALVTLSNDLLLRAALIQRGLERISNFSWQKCAMETLDVYRRVLA